MRPSLALRLFVPASMFCALILPAAAEVEEGLSRDAVIEKLGEPDGRLNAGGLEMLQYKLGTVELQDGVVVSSDILTQEEFDRRQAREQKRMEEQRARDAEAREKRITAGNAELKRVQEDETFDSKSASDRVKYWQNFRRKYPEVDVSSQLNAAQAEVRAEEVRMAELKDQFEQGMRQPPFRMSSRRQRKFWRGRSPGHIQQRSDQLMAELFPEKEGD